MNLIKCYIKSIFETANSRARAIQRLEDLADTYTEYVCKLFLWGDCKLFLWGDQDPEWRKDWTDEIYNCIFKIANIELKGNKRLKEKDYLEFFFFKYMEDWEFPKKLNATNHYFRDRYNYPKANYVNAEKAYEQYKEFVKKVIGSVVQNKVFYKEIKRLCREYLTGKE